MGTVVRLSAKRAKTVKAFAMGPIFESAWSAYPESGRRRSSRLLSAPEWAKCILHIGDGDLLEAVARYAKEDTDHRKDCGAPAFHRWLAWGRWESWLAEEATKPKEFADPVLRGAFQEQFSDARARAWFDECSLMGDTLVIGWLPRPDWLAGPFTRWAVANRIGGWRLK